MKLKKKIVLLPGDGVGPEVSRAAWSVLQECAREFQHQFDLVELPVGGSGIDKTGSPLPNETLDACRKADAIFLGAVGGPKWDSLPVGKRPESGLLDLRKGLGLYVNLRPVKVIEPLRGIWPLKSFANWPGECTSVSAGTRWREVSSAPSTPKPTPPRRLNASRRLASRGPKAARAGSARWTKQTC